MIRWLAFHLILRPMILWDYRQREKGCRPDRIHWADRLAMSWGYFV